MGDPGPGKVGIDYLNTKKKKRTKAVKMKMIKKEIREKLKCPKCGYKQTYFRKRDNCRVCPKCGHIEKVRSL